MNFDRSVASKAARFLALAAGMLVLFGCGGGSNNTPPPPVVVVVSISPTSGSVATGATQQFTATVTGTSNTSVTWSLSGGAGQNLGTISSAGLYTAPTSVPSPASVTVTAKSVADTSKLASATVTIIEVGITILPTSTSVPTNGTKQFTATVTGTTNTAVTWSLSGGAGQDLGTVSLTGLYTAPASLPSPAQVTVTATSQADPTKSASASVTITANGISVSVSPSSATVSKSATQQFTATVTGTANTNVTWSVNGTDGGDSTHGTIDVNGLYTAPATVPSPATVTVKATSVADTASFDTATVTILAVNNTATVVVGVEPDLGSSSFVNIAFVDVTICEPGSTSNCQTIPNVEVDTGSEGLRLLKSVVTLNLQPVTDGTPNQNQLQECVQFADYSYIWGPVYSADVQMADEKASSVPVQLIPSSDLFTPPSACTANAPPNGELNTLAQLGANGIIGLGVFQQDCGAYCANNPPLQYDPYYYCPSSGCVQAIVPTDFQLQNPVWMFPQDNNGFLITLPSIADTGAVSVTGTITFGIGTQVNNGLGSAKVYTIDYSGGATTGDFATTFGGKTYGYGGVANSDSYIDSGSNGLYILDSTTLGQGMLDCTQTGYSGFYCPGSSSSASATTITYTATNAGVNGTSADVNFTIGNAIYLDSFNNFSNWAFNDYGGANPLVFDYGLPFFFGRTIFIGIENQTVGSATGPLWAY